MTNYLVLFGLAVLVCAISFMALLKGDDSIAPPLVGTSLLCIVAALGGVLFELIKGYMACR